MQLGSFWGQTAPMFLLECTSIDEYKDFLHLAQSSLGRQSLEDFRCELINLSKTLNQVIYEPKVKTNTMEQYKRCCKICDGKFFVKGEENPLIKASLIQEMCFNLILKILRGEQKGKYINVPNYSVEGIKNFILESVNNAVSKATGRLPKLEIEIAQLYESFLSSSATKSIAPQLCEAFPIKISFPKSVKTASGTIKLTDLQIKVWEVLFQRKNILDELIDSFDSTFYDEVNIFNTSFYDLVKRNPICLYFIIKQDFDYVNSRQSKSYLNNLIEKVRTEVDQFMDCLDKLVVSTSDTAHADTSLNDFGLLETIPKGYAPRYEFFSDLLSKSYLKASDITNDILALLVRIYDCVECFNCDGLNDLFDTEFDEDSWCSFGKELSKLGICGINGYAVELLFESISKMTFSDGVKVVKTEEDLNRFHEVLDNIYCLLDTLIPIGEVIT